MRFAWIVAVCLLAAPRSTWAHEPVERRIAEVTAQLAGAPNDAALYARRGALYAQARNWTQAVADLEEARAIDANAERVALPLANALLHTADYARVIDVLDQELAREGRNPDAYLLRGRARIALGEYERAGADFTRAIDENDAPIARTFCERARALSSSGDVDAAVASLRAGVETVGPATSIVELAITMEVARGNHEEALVWVGELAEDVAATPRWAAERGRLLAAAGRIEQAKLAYAEAAAAIASLPTEERATAEVAALAEDVEASVDALAVAPTDPAPDGGLSPLWIAVAAAIAAGLGWLLSRRAMR